MRQKFWMRKRLALRTTFRETLLLGLLTAAIILIPLVGRAIVPLSIFTGQVPALVSQSSQNKQANPTDPNAFLIPYSQMPGGQLFAAALSSLNSAARQNPNLYPRMEQVAVNPTNYDYRMPVDVDGNPANYAPIVVLHETVGSASSAINRFTAYTPNDNDQASYHSLIKRDGTIVFLVPPEFRAFGAGNSVFVSRNGAETVKLDPILPPSVNNFAYHTSLESPSDGRGNGRGHSGYTEAQYRSLAWLVAQTRVPPDRITTHQRVDRSGSRRDPRSFNAQRFNQLLNAYYRAAS